MCVAGEGGKGQGWGALCPQEAVPPTAQLGRLNLKPQTHVRAPSLRRVRLFGTLRTVVQQASGGPLCVITLVHVAEKMLMLSDSCFLWATGLGR